MNERTTIGIWHHAFDFDRLTEPHLLEGEVARRTVRVGLLFAAASALLFSLLYVVTGPAEFIAANFLSSVALLALALLPRRDTRLQLYGAVTIALALLGYQLLLLGRVDNGITVWFLVPSIATALLGMWRLAVYCAATGMAEIVAIVAAARLGWLQPVVTIPEAEVVMAGSTIATLALCVIFAAITYQARRRLLADIEQGTLALEHALEESRLARSEAVEASEAKDRFFANLTHEIRTPLNGICGTAELLESTALSADQAPLVEALATSTRSLVSLVNAMLDHARLSAGYATVDVAPFEPRLVASEIAGTYRSSAEDKGLQVTITVDPAVPRWVDGDRVKLTQILANLVANAVKFTEHGGVQVGFEYRPGPAHEPGAGGTLIAAVTDTGIGIPDDAASAVFRPFVQADESIGRAYGGSGLGLAIAQQLATLMGGTLRLASRVGAGSTFTLEIPAPMADPPSASADQTDRPPAPIAGAHVLLVEDNAINRMVAQSMLRRAGADVAVATSGEMAVDLAARSTYDLILMDLQMPGLDGISASREIRCREAEVGRAAVPIIAMSGNSPADYGEACTAAGMDGFLMKPVGTAELGRVLAGIDSRES